MLPYNPYQPIHPVISDETLREMVRTKCSGHVSDGWRHISNSLYMNVKPGNESIVAIPEYFDSLQTLEFLGFDKEVAQLIWSTYQEMAKTRSLDEFIHGCIADFWNDFPQDVIDAIDEWDEWDEIIVSFGIGDDLRQRIMAPGYEKIRLTQTAHWWITQTIMERFKFLGCIDLFIGNVFQEKTLERPGPNESLLWTGGVLCNLQAAIDNSNPCGERPVNLQWLDYTEHEFFQSQPRGTTLFESREMAR